ncbi:MAG: twin-arginine translocase TatA/TatE family subunit [Gemmataceae bacterium]|nr:twin-arginine translocase TatA/TatE family subunit [Gemmataceae bacterium]
MTPLFAFLSPTTMIILGVIAVLIFGRRLPEIAKSLGKSITEFKKGAAGLENGFDDIVNPSASASPASASAAPAEPIRPPQRVAPAAPKFDDVPANAAPANTAITAAPPQP